MTSVLTYHNLIGGHSAEASNDILAEGLVVILFLFGATQGKGCVRLGAKIIYNNNGQKISFLRPHSFYESGQMKLQMRTCRDKNI